MSQPTPQQSRSDGTPSSGFSPGPSAAVVCLFAGAFSLAVACTVGAILFALHGIDATPFFVIISSIVAGTLGLVAKSPIT
jgi:hypothetical protein